VVVFKGKTGVGKGKRMEASWVGPTAQIEIHCSLGPSLLIWSLILIWNATFVLMISDLILFAMPTYSRDYQISIDSILGKYNTISYQK
jgi:hypothetical protein